MRRPQSLAWQPRRGAALGPRRGAGAPGARRQASSAADSLPRLHSRCSDRRGCSGAHPRWRRRAALASARRAPARPSLGGRRALVAASPGAAEKSQVNSLLCHHLLFQAEEPLAGREPPAPPRRAGRAAPREPAAGKVAAAPSSGARRGARARIQENCIAKPRALPRACHFTRGDDGALDALKKCHWREVLFLFPATQSRVTRNDHKQIFKMGAMTRNRQ